MNRDEIKSRIRQIKAERSDVTERMARIRALSEALGASPTLTGLMAFLRELRAVIGGEGT